MSDESGDEIMCDECGVEIGTATVDAVEMHVARADQSKIRFSSWECIATVTLRCPDCHD